MLTATYNKYFLVFWDVFTTFAPKIAILIEHNL